jgi:hypothetical protein
VYVCAYIYVYICIYKDMQLYIHIYIFKWTIVVSFIQFFWFIEEVHIYFHGFPHFLYILDIFVALNSECFVCSKCIFLQYFDSWLQLFYWKRNRINIYLFLDYSIETISLVLLSVNRCLGAWWLVSFYLPIHQIKLFVNLILPSFFRVNPKWGCKN